jgi:hypothetical protein
MRFFSDTAVTDSITIGQIVVLPSTQQKYLADGIGEMFNLQVGHAWSLETDCTYISLHEICQTEKKVGTALSTLV